MIQFPVVRRIAISGYQLFPGLAGEGLDHTLPRGVSLVVGINGLGKTTLLNAVFRALSGPYDWAKRRVNQPAGSTPVKLKDFKNFAYFRRRVRDEAAHASIEVTVGFGEDTILIRRSLRNLALTKLVVRGQGVEANEKVYQETVTSLAGLKSFEDFFLVLRYITFFFEERQPIVWDPDAQSDILRVLFFNPDTVTRVRQLFDQIQSLDSRRRSIRAVYNTAYNKLQNARSALATQPELVVRATALQTRANALAERYSELVQSLEESDHERHEARLRVETTKLDVESLRSEYAAYERAHLLYIFPNAADTARYVFLRRETGCLVCGNESEDASAHIDECAESHICPSCHRQLEPDPRIVSSGEVNRLRMQELDGRVNGALEALAQRQESLVTANKRHDSDVKELRETRNSISDVRRQLDQVNAQLPPTQEQLAALVDELQVLERDMETYKAEQNACEQEFAELLADGERTVHDLSGRISQRFTQFAGEFLSETCDLQYDTESRKIGEEGTRFSFPRFTVRMTSATMGREMSPRRQAGEVSESQREFLDLAFRMALMDVAAAGRAAMLVIETPEASLDVLFVGRAGRLLGEFALAGDGDGNRLLATSNLTGGEMIPALLGTLQVGDGQLPVHHVPSEKRAEHVINLLDVAAPNAAIQAFRDDYRRNFQRAVFPKED
jgi:DNA repair exonuclease SbcCD ATPase subunit